MVTDLQIAGWSVEEACVQIADNEMKLTLGVENLKKLGRTTDESNDMRHDAG